MCKQHFDSCVNSILIPVLTSVGDGNLTDLYPGYVYINYKLKTDLQCCRAGKGAIISQPQCSYFRPHQYDQSRTIWPGSVGKGR